MYLVVLIDGYLDKYGSDFSVAGIYSTYDKALDAIEKLCNKDKIIIDEKDRKSWETLYLKKTLKS